MFKRLKEIPVLRARGLQTSSRFLWPKGVCVFLLLLLAVPLWACFRPVGPTPTQSANQALLETRVEQDLSATLTAKAPTPTATITSASPTITPTETLAVTATPSPSPTQEDPATALAFVQMDEEGIRNVVFYNREQQQLEKLTRFAEQQRVYDLTYSYDGRLLAMVSSHDFMHTRDQEHNVMIMRADGTDLEIVTGDYVDPEEMPPPYVTLFGEVQGAQGACRVSAQGAVSIVAVDDEGRFELSGVPSEAEWARVLCQEEDRTWHGDVDLSIPADVTRTEPISITLVETGQGWRQVTLSPDNEYLAGVHYRWERDQESGERSYRFSGRIYDLVTHVTTTLEMPEQTTLMGLAWSPITDTIVGGVSAEEDTSLWRWSADGKMVDQLASLENTDEEILAIGQMAFSRDGRQLAFELRRWNWWGENEYRTDLMLLAVETGQITLLYEGSWGNHATHPSWSADGKYVFFGLSRGEPGNEAVRSQPGEIMRVNTNTLVHMAWTTDIEAFLPAIRITP